MLPGFHDAATDFAGAPEKRFQRVGVAHPDGALETPGIAVMTRG